MNLLHILKKIWRCCWFCVISILAWVVFHNQPLDDLIDNCLWCSFSLITPFDFNINNIKMGGCERGFWFHYERQEIELLSFSSFLFLLNLKREITQFSAGTLTYMCKPGGAQVSVYFGWPRALVAFYRSCSGNYVLPWIYIILVNHSQHLVSQEPAATLLDCLYKVEACFLHFCCSFSYNVFVLCSFSLSVIIQSDWLE